MDSAAVNVRMFGFSQRAKSSDPLGRPQSDDLSSSSEPTASADKHKTRSISWLTPHRRKDSGISISTKSSVKSTRVPSTTATATSIRSNRSSSSSRLSRESDLFDSSRIASTTISEQSAPSELSSGLRSPSYPPPKRPDRPQESLFDSPIVYEADEAAEADRNVEYVRAASLDIQIRRRSRELLGFSLDAIRAPSPDVRNRLSFISVTGSESSGPSYHSIIPSHSNRNNQHQKTLSETIANSYLSRKVSSATTRSTDPGSPSLNMADGSTTKLSKSARWTLTESMADMFKTQKKSSKSKAEPKPMTPARIEAIWNHQDPKKSPERKKENKEQKEQDKKKKKKTDKKSLIGSPKLADLLRSPSAAGGEIARSDPVRRGDGQPTSPRERAIPFEIAIPPPPMSAFYNHNTNTPEPKPSLAQQMICPDAAETRQGVDHEMEHESGQQALVDEPRAEEDKAAEPQIFVIPPPKHSTRFASRAPTLPQLPPIPEGFRPQADSRVLKPRPQPSHKRSRSLSQVGVEKGDRVYLKSTPFTLTNPGFRHGPITFQKSEMKRYSTGAILAESPVDWTAFQAAIGGVGDLSEVFPAEPGELELEEENQLADEMTEWFAEFGFETHGELIGAEKSPKRYYDRLSWDSMGSLDSTSSVPSTVKTETEEDMQTPRVACSQQHASMYDAMKLLCDQKGGGSGIRGVSVYESTMDAAKQQRLLV